MSHITREQRYTIEALLTNGKTQSFIATVIKKSKSVVSREISRNKDKRTGNYKASLAQFKYDTRKSNKAQKKRFTASVKKLVDKFLKKDFSPEQISGYCKVNNIKCVSHERIYQYVWEDKKQGGNLHSHLRRKGRRYRKRGNKKDTRGIIKGRVDIDERPEIVEKKERFGDLEIDTIIGRNHKGAIVTINDRASGYLWMKKVKRRTADAVFEATVYLLKKVSKHVKTITADNGKEFAFHEKIANSLNVKFFFAKPYHSWERGANENLNGLIRQYIPKKTDFDTITDKFVKQIQNKINRRPRKRFKFKNPIFVKNELLTKIKSCI
jgi:IS30 family transposase